MTIHQAQQQLFSRLCHLYDNREAATVADWVMENITGWKKIDRIVHKELPLSTPQAALLEKYTAALLTHTPVQYVLQEAWFCGMKFYVDNHVLIPRPETEELVEWIVQDVQNAKYEVRTVLDVGTGSGCIGVALKKKLAAADVYACDVSVDALDIARRNAGSNEAAVHFLQLDFLNNQDRHSLPAFDLIVSNPPYIPLKDKATMHANVVNFEPHLALFVENHDPLIFYEAIGGFAKEKLLPQGKVFVEVHEELAGEVSRLFRSQGFSTVEIKKDLQGKERMIKATTLL